RASRRIGELLTNLADMTRIEEGRLRLERKRVASDDLLREVPSPRQWEARRRRIDMSYGIAPGAAHLEVDCSLFVRVIENLLDNAIRYTPPHGRISLNIRRVETGTRIEVGNSGAPVPASARTVVFEKFGQARGD